MTDGKAPRRGALLRGREPVRVHVQLGLRVAHGDRLLLVGPSPARAPGPRPAAAHARHRCSTSGAASCASDEHPHSSGGPDGLLLNWNNQSAPGFMHGDDDAVRLGAPRRAVRQVPAPGHAGRRRERHEPRRDRGRALAGVAGRQPGAARRCPRRTRLAAAAVDVLDDWVQRDAPRLDADNRRHSTTMPAPTIMNALWRPIAEAVMRPVFGDLPRRPRRRPRPRRPRRRVVRRQGPAHAARTAATSTASSTCATAATGSLDACRASLWAAVDQAALARSPRPQGPNPAAWRSPARRTGFTPGLIPDTFRATNRPTFQQVLELTNRR